MYLTLYPAQERNPYTDHLRLGLRDLGYVEGRDYTLEHRHADGQPAKLPEVARQIVREAPEVIVTGVNAFTRIAQTVGTPQPQELALGIFTALVTTIWGLLVAIPALGFHFFFKLRVQRIAVELSGAAKEMVERLRPVAGGKPA